MNELADRLPQLRIATSRDDGVNLIGLAAHRQLQAAGVEPTAVENAGGQFLYNERPFVPIAAFRDEAANVLIHEAIMTPHWQRITENKQVVYLDATREVLNAFHEWQWPSAVVAQGYLPGLDHDLTALEFSDFLVLCTEDLPSDVASLIAWCMTATRDALEVHTATSRPTAVRSPIHWIRRPSPLRPSRYIPPPKRHTARCGPMKHPPRS